MIPISAHGAVKFGVSMTSTEQHVTGRSAQNAEEQQCRTQTQRCSDERRCVTHGAGGGTAAANECHFRVRQQTLDRLYFDRASDTVPRIDRGGVSTAAIRRRRRGLTPSEHLQDGGRGLKVQRNVLD